MRPRFVRAQTALIMFSLAPVSCGHENGPGGLPDGTLQVHTNPQPTDTIGAVLPSGIQADVLDSDSEPLVGVNVVFRWLPRDDVSTRQPSTGLTSWEIGEPPPEAWQSYAVDNSDQNGHVNARLQLGATAGEIHIEVSAVNLGFVDTLTLIVHPGAPVGVAMLLRDTAAYVGRSVQLRGSVVDRFLNTRPEPVTYSSITSNVQVDQQGKVTALGLGRGAVQLGGFGQSVDTAWVSVVPEGRFAAYRNFGGDTVGLAGVNLDGSGYEFLVPTPGFADYPDCIHCSLGATLSWAPGSTALVHTGMGLPGENQTSGVKLYTYTLGSPGSQLLLPTQSGTSREGPQFSREGDWILFGARVDGYLPTLFRVKGDGTGLAHIGPAKSFLEVNWKPSPSRTGDRVAYVTNATGGTSIRVLDIATDTSSSWSVAGTNPQWSPSADVIAFVEDHGGAIRLLNADGTGLRTLTAEGKIYLEGAFDWSPDGRLILARSATGFLDVINVETGLTLPLPFSSALYNPRWQNLP